VLLLHERRSELRPLQENSSLINVLIPNIIIEFGLPEGVEPPGQGMIDLTPGEEPKVTRLKGKVPVTTSTKKDDPLKDPWEARIEEKEAAAKQQPRPRVIGKHSVCRV
jgi:hypothetical protein